MCYSLPLRPCLWRAVALWLWWFWGLNPWAHCTQQSRRLPTYPLHRFRLHQLPAFRLISDAVCFYKTNALLYCFPALAIGRTATGTLHRPPHPAALMSVTVTMLLAGGWPRWQQPRATPVTWTMTQNLCPHRPHPEASTCQRRRTMKAAPLPHTRRGVTPTTSTRHHPPPARTPPEEGPSSSDCLHRDM